MSKAILIIDMPNSCEECDVIEFCHSNDWKTNLKIKPDWCPLRELPQKHTVHCTDTTHHRHVKQGWNYCIDEILKEGTEW